MKKKLLSIVAALIFVSSCFSVAFAVPDAGGIQPYETDAVTYVINRTSSTKANVSVIVDFSQRVDRYSVVVYLQKLSNGSWVLDTANDDYVYYNNGQNARDFDFNKTYSDLERGVTYRLQVVSKDYIGSSSHSSTTYSNAF